MKGVQTAGATVSPVCQFVTLSTIASRANSMSIFEAFFRQILFGFALASD